MHDVPGQQTAWQLFLVTSKDQERRWGTFQISVSKKKETQLCLAGRENKLRHIDMSLSDLKRSKIIGGIRDPDRCIVTDRSQDAAAVPKPIGQAIDPQSR